MNTKETTIESKAQANTKKVVTQKPTNFIRILSGELLDDAVYRYVVVSDVPFKVGEVLSL